MLLLCNVTFPIIASIGTNIQYTIRVRMNETYSSKCVVAMNEQNLVYVSAEMAYGLLQLVITRNVP